MPPSTGTVPWRPRQAVIEIGQLREGVHLNQTECPPGSPAWSGSPGCLVAKRVEPPVPGNKEPLIAIASDKEATSSDISLMFKLPVERTRTVGDYLQRTLPNGTLRIIDNVGHCPHLSAPSASEAAMKQFLAGL